MNAQNVRIEHIYKVIASCRPFIVLAGYFIIADPFFVTVSVFSKGQCETVAYRFLSKKGGYAWVVTQATLIHCSKQHKPLSVVCVNYILR